MTNNLILWGVGTSRTIRPHWALHELDLSYDMRPILPRTGETKTAEFTALNPRQKIPLLQDSEIPSARARRSSRIWRGAMAKKRIR